MKNLYLTICLCVAGLIVAVTCSGQEQVKGERALQKEVKALQRGDGAMSGDGGLMGEGGGQEAIIGKIVNNPKFISELGLTDDQVKTLKTSMEEMRKHHEILQKQLKDAGMEQAKLMTGDSVDENAVLASIEKAGKIRTEMAKARIKHLLQVKKILTPAQTGKIRDMLQNRMKQLPAGGGDLHNQKGKNEGENWKEKRLKRRQEDKKDDDKKDEGAKPAGTST